MLLSHQLGEDFRVQGFTEAAGAALGLLIYNLLKTLADRNGTSLTKVLNERIKKKIYIFKKREKEDILWNMMFDDTVAWS